MIEMTRRMFAGFLASGLTLPGPWKAKRRDDEMQVRDPAWDFGGGRMLCFANRSSPQMLSTVFVSKGGHVAVVDGGHLQEGKDGEFLLAKLLSLGGRIDHWFITHAHIDHYGALFTMMKKPEFKKLKIGELVFSFPDVDWMAKKGEPGAKKNTVAFLARLKECAPELKTRRYVKGEVIKMDGISFEVLNDYNLDCITCDPVNGTSICLGVNMGNRRILVTGDVSTNEGHWLASDPANAARFKADICFLTHHGQNGAPKKFYEMVKPEAAIWPCPEWLWENSSGGGGPGSGPYNTNYTKCWMQELGVKKNYPLVRDYVFC